MRLTTTRKDPERRVSKVVGVCVAIRNRSDRTLTEGKMPPCRGGVSVAVVTNPAPSSMCQLDIFGAISASRT